MSFGPEKPLTPTAFEVEFEFRVDGKSNSLYGDGFAMWLARERAEFGPVFGSKGGRECVAEAHNHKLTLR